MNTSSQLYVCPFCKSKDTLPFIECKDHTVSGEIFPVVACNDCSGMFTAGAPAFSEIGKYYQSDSYISHTDSKKGVFNRIYQLIRNFTIGQKKKFVISKAAQKKGAILDYGCGTGNFLASMKTSGWNVKGIEPDPSACQKAADATGEVIHPPDHINQIESSSHDVITLWHVLEHVHDLHHVIAEFKRILNQDGVLVIAVPNHLSYDAKFYRQFWAAYDVPRHLYHFNPASIQQLFTRYGFKLESINPMWFDAFYVGLLSEKHKNGKMGLVTPLVVGFLSNLKALFKKGTCSSQIYTFTLSGRN